ncbi:MAG: 30S ribosomal protein S9 [Bacteroidota bacterium]
MDKIITVGRRKASVARVIFNEGGTGKFIVNKREFENYFPIDLDRLKILAPFRILELSNNNFDIQVNVRGGGSTGQAEAVRLGISRALEKVNEEYRPPLKAAGFMTRDARVVERKKYGKKKARKSSQFSKR